MYVYQRTLSFTRHLRIFIGLNSRKRISRVFQLLVVAGRFSYCHFLCESCEFITSPFLTRLMVELTIEKYLTDDTVLAYCNFSGTRYGAR